MMKAVETVLTWESETLGLSLYSARLSLAFCMTLSKIFSSLGFSFLMPDTEQSPKQVASDLLSSPSLQPPATAKTNCLE